MNLTLCCLNHLRKSGRKAATSGVDKFAHWVCVVELCWNDRRSDRHASRWGPSPISRLSTSNVGVAFFNEDGVSGATIQPFFLKEPNAGQLDSSPNTTSSSLRLPLIKSCRACIIVWLYW